MQDSRIDSFRPLKNRNFSSAVWHNKYRKALDRHRGRTLEKRVTRGRQAPYKNSTRIQTRVLAILGVEAYRKAFDRRDAVLGLQAERIGESALWVLPNPSGINAHFQLKELVKFVQGAPESPQKS